MSDFLINWLAMVPVFAAPFALAALGLLVTERSGVLCLAAEGYMLIGAIAAVGASLTFGGYPLLPLAAGAVAAAVVSLLFALLVLVFRVEQVIAGLALVFFCLGLSSLIGSTFGWTSRTVSGNPQWPIPGLSEIPVLGRLLFSQDLIVYLLVPLTALVAYLLNGTMTGLRLKAVGDSPDAADAAGVSILGTRLAAILAGAALMGLAGAYLSVVVAKIWVDGMTGGRGWIAIALVIFSGWRPWRALGAALLFGSIEALVPRVAASGFAIPQYFLFMLPYLATLGVMVWTAWRGGGGGAPRALGRPFLREDRH
ncbi:ABC transporter permease [Methylobrevis pamukkalensis]|uniref:Branched-chain amino acid transport system / permease component n=1 Tax=Methylobrevis pamukkalensis TaxID=1439726 RepID=A0A1E3H4N6_9HYPH|nr:ABC transporter permease [Methylobrevis pamukkalensis]ODN71115.1 Branched-chain amino acid transport system / permease component [Methylobrevis pamukkalensis]